MATLNARKLMTVSNGFTLIEVLITVLLIGVTIVSLMISSSTFTKANGAGIELSTAEFLIEEARERTTAMAFNDLADFADTYSPPQDVQGNELNNFSAFSQQVTVTNVSASDLQTPDPGSDFVRVTVNILMNNRQISSASWIRARQ